MKFGILGRDESNLGRVGVAEESLGALRSPLPIHSVEVSQETAETSSIRPSEQRL